MTNEIEELLSGTVDEVKEAILENDFSVKDLEEIMEEEKEGDDRKTLERFLSRQIEQYSDEGASEEEGVEEAESGMGALKGKIEERLREGEETEEERQERIERVGTEWGADHCVTGVPGFDKLFTRGIPKGAPVLVAGGAGSGKTIFCLQTLAHHAAQGEKCFYMSFEESEEKLKNHMRDFGWNPDALIKKDKLRIKRFSPFDITRQVEAMLAEEKGELLIDVDPVLLPKGFKPDFVVIDSLTALASAFTGQEDSYRIYIEQLFRFFEELGATSFMISETAQEPETFSPTGVEEFLADGVIVIYNFKRGDVRERAIEVLKMRGENHEEKIVAMQISDNGITVYPEQEVFSAME